MQNSATIVAIQTLGSHKVLLLSNGQVHLFSDPATRIHLRPAEATVLYDFLLENLSFIERRKAQHEQN
jgi:hypothetical protein